MQKRASWSVGKRSRRTKLEHSILWLDRHDFYRLSFRAVHATAGGSLRGTIREKFVQMQKNVLSLSQIGVMFPFRSSGITRSLTTKRKKSRKEKT
jgi:hypothetical protein